MSVYTCAATSQNVKPSNEFKEKNINGVPCPIGLADVIAYVPFTLAPCRLLGL